MLLAQAKSLWSHQLRKLKGTCQRRGGRRKPGRLRLCFELRLLQWQNPKATGQNPRNCILKGSKSKLPSNSKAHRYTQATRDSKNESLPSCQSRQILLTNETIITMNNHGRYFKNLEPPSSCTKTRTKSKKSQKSPKAKSN